MNSFFASCEQQMNPELRGQPVVVAPVMVDSTCAIAASYEAKAFGIKTGTPIGEAKKRCSNLKVVQARPKHYVEYHHRFREAIETCIPIESVMSIDEVACKLDRVQVQPHMATKLANAIKAAIRDRAGASLLCSVGVAANRLLAKLACDMEKPDGLTLLLPENMPNAILHLKLDDFAGVGPNMLKRLNRAGIQSIAQLWAADPDFLKRIWGSINGTRFHALLHGADLPAQETSRKSIGHQHVLSPEERTVERATPIIRQLLTKLGQRLRKDDLYCRKLTVDIKWTQNLGYYAKECRFSEARDTPFLLERLTDLWKAVPPMKPLRVGVTLSDLVPAASYQPDLFENGNNEKLTAAIDRLNLRFGRGAVGFGSAAKPMTSKIAFQRVPKLDEF
jgi:DNA polymerase IV